jgi:ribosomal protein S18 acetylase RimI-like enzyme
VGNHGLKNIILRDAVPADHDAVVAISTITQHEHEARLPDIFLPGSDHTMPDTFAAALSNLPRVADAPFARLIVACQNDRVIGHVLLLFNQTATAPDLYDLRCHIHDLSVHPDFRARGIGSGLMAQALDVCREEGATDLQGYVWQGNSASMQLFTKAHFVPAATLFSKRLGPPLHRAATCDARSDQASALPTGDMLIILGVVVAILLTARLLS